MNESKTLNLIGEVKNKNVVLVDGIIHTAGSMINAANLLKTRGALSVIICAIHGLFSGNALERASNSDVKEVLKHPEIKVVSTAPFWQKR